MHTRNAALVGLLFVTIGVVFWAIPTFGGWHVDYAGVTMLILLGVAMSIMTWALVAGSASRD